MRNLLFITSLLLISCELMISGSYPYSENYSIDMSIKQLNANIKKLKDNNPNFKVYTVDNLGNRIELKDTISNHFYTYYFNIGKDSTLFCAVNINYIKKPVKFQLISLSTNKYFGSWKEINSKDLNKDENLKLKKKFEKTILPYLSK